MIKETVQNKQISQQICILGGTFNPIHNGHIALAIQAYKQFHFDKVLIMPSGTPAYKDQTNLASGKQRCEMVRLAIEPYPYMELSTLEITRGGNTYTADTLLQMLDEHPYLDIYFIIGADSLFYIDKWYKPDIVMQHCHLLVANRDLHRQSELEVQRNYLIKQFGAVIDFLHTDDLPYSSTHIREYAAAHKDITQMVPPNVAAYIQQQHLYQQEQIDTDR